jgi:hypothetical protein
MGALLVLYDLGAIAAWIVLYNRVGFPEVRQKYQVDWREFLLPNLAWFGLFILKGLLWPVALGAWFASGSPKVSAWRAVTQADGMEARRIVRVIGKQNASTDEVVG